MKPLDLTGQRFGRLVAVARVPDSRPTKWECRCDCGNIVTVRADHLKSGNTKSCGCLNKENIKRKRRNSDDITGKTIGNLEIIRYEKSGKNGAEWLCRCTLCGASPILPTHYIMTNKSCGCLSKNAAKKAANKLHETLTTTKTNPEAIRKDKPNKNSKTGIKGVCFLEKQGHYVAYIQFQGKRYTLKKSKNIEGCIKARKEAEQELFGNFLEWYDEMNKKSPSKMRGIFCAISVLHTQRRC